MGGAVGGEWEGRTGEARRGRGADGGWGGQAGAVRDGGGAGGVTRGMPWGSGAIAELTGLAADIAGADLVITGEGRYDGQSEAGKAPAHVAQLARAAGVPVALVAGAIEADASGFAASASLTELAGSTAAALADPLRWLRDAGEHLAG